MLNLESLRFVVDTSELERAAEKIDNLGNKLEKASSKPASQFVKATEKASQSTKQMGDAAEGAANKIDKVKKATETAISPVEGLQKKLKNTFVDLSEGFTRGESAILNMARSLNASESEMAAIRAILKDISSFLKDPFDSAIGSVRSITREFEMLQQRANLANQGIVLTTKQLREYSRIADEVAGRAKAKGLDPTQGQGKEWYTKTLNEQQTEYLKVAQAANSLTQAEKDRNAELKKQEALMRANATAGDAMVAQFRKIQEGNYKEAEAIRKKAEAQRIFNEQFMKFSAMGYGVGDAKRGAGMVTRGATEADVLAYLNSAKAQREATAAAKEKETADRKAAKAAADREAAEKSMGDAMVAQYRRRAKSIDDELRKLKEQRDALKAGSGAVTGNTVFRLTNLGASADQIKQARELRKEIEELGKAARKTENPMKGFASVLRQLIPTLGALSGGAILARMSNEFIRTADYLTTFEARLNFLSKGTLEFNSSFEKLIDISNEARVSVQDTSTFFSRLVPVMQSIGRSAGDAFTVTESFSKLLLVSGTSAREASAAMYQLSQALGKGKLDGDEFRTVAEATPELLRILEKQLGVTRAELYKMSEQGRLTSEVIIDALGGALGELDSAAKKMPLTVEGALKQLGNEATALVKVVDDATNISGRVAEMIKGFSDIFKVMRENQDVVVVVMGALAGAGAVAGVVALTSAIAGSAGLLTALTALGTILTGPVGVLLGLGAAAGAASAYLNRTPKDIDGITSKITRLNAKLEEYNRNRERGLYTEQGYKERVDPVIAELKELKSRKALLSAGDVYGNEERRERSRQSEIAAAAKVQEQLAAARREIAGFKGDYNKFLGEMAELDKLAKAGLSKSEVAARTKQIYEKYGVTEKGKKGKSDEEKEAQKIQEAYNREIERGKTMLIEATGAQEDYTKAQKALMDLKDDDVWEKFTKEQRAEIENKYNLASAAQIEAQEYNTVVKIRERINDITDEAIQIQNRYTDAQKLALDIFNDPAFAKLSDVRKIEIAEALELAHAEELIAKNRKAVQSITDEMANRRRDFSTDVKRKEFEYSLSGQPSAVKDIALKKYDIEAEKIRKIDELKKKLREGEINEQGFENFKYMEEEFASEQAAWVEREAQIKKATEQAEQFSNIFADAFSDLIVEGKSFSDVISSIEKNLINMITQMLVVEPLKASLQGFFKSSGGFEGMASSIGSFFGGFFAEGGRPPLNKVSVVGEKGPELFVPDTAGTVIPNSALTSANNSSSQNVTIIQNFTIQGSASNPATQSQIAAAALKGAQKAMRRDG